MVCAVSLSGCTVVRVEGPARVSSARFGVLRIEPAGGTVIYHARGVGVVGGHDGVTLGARAETVAIMPRGACQIILFEADRAAVDTLVAALASVVSAPGQICSVGEK